MDGRGRTHELLPLPPSLPENPSGHRQGQERVTKELGITEAMKPFRWWTNNKRRFKRGLVTNRILGG